MSKATRKRTHEEKIIEYLRSHPEGADDDELAERLGMKYRQDANQICRMLESRGVVSRKVDYARGPRGKIVNTWKG